MRQVIRSLANLRLGKDQVFTFLRESTCITVGGKEKDL